MFLFSWENVIPAKNYSEILIILFSVNFPVVSGEAEWQLFSKLNILKYFTIIVTLLSPPLRWVRSAGQHWCEPGWTWRAYSCSCGGRYPVTSPRTCYRPDASRGCGSTGIPGYDIIYNISYNVCDVCCYYRNNLYEYDVHWPDHVHHSWWPMLCPAFWHGSWRFCLSSLLLGLTCLYLFRSADNRKQ